MTVPTTGFGLVALELVIACTDYWFWYGCFFLKKNNDELCCTPEEKEAVESGMVQHKQHWIKDAAGTGLGGPTGSGKTLVATVQCNTGIGGSCLFQRYL